MKRIIVAALLAAGIAAPATAQTVVRIGTNGDNVPYSMLAADGTPIGYEIALGTAICERAGLTCEFTVTPWATMIPDLQAGAFDVIMTGMAITAERQLEIDFSEPYYPAGISRFVARAGTTFDFAALAGVRIGVNGGTIQSAYVEANLVPANTIVTFVGAEAAMVGLEAAEVDLVLAHTDFALPRVVGTNGALIVVGPEVTIGGGVGAGFRKEDAALRETFNRIIAGMKADGSLNALIVEWFDAPRTF